MPSIHFLPDDKEIEANEGETILQAALRAGIPLAHVCGGNARCSTCRVLIVKGRENCPPPDAAEARIAQRLLFDPMVRLACQTVPTGDVQLRRLVLDDEDIALNILLLEGVEAGPSGVEKMMFILFLDIEKFTAFAENLLPYDVIHALNKLFHRMGEVVSAHQGQINTYLGDGFMALFEADDPGAGALRAVGAGLEMLARTRSLQPYFAEVYHKGLEIRLGLHYGRVVAGAVGSPGYKKMTVIGDAVNLASRIEEANKAAGTRFLISEPTFTLVKERVRVGRLVSLKLPGKTGKYRLYEVLGLIPGISP